MALNKKRILPDEYVVKQGDKGNTAFLIISGALNVEINGKKVGKMESGEIFGELSLILGEERKASIKAIVPTEIIEIKKNALEAILLSSLCSKSPTRWFATLSLKDDQTTDGF